MRKGQFSFEFLMTYGWAFLIITVVLAAVYTYGLLDLTGILPEKCEFFGQIECQDYKVNVAEQNISIIVLNDFNADLVIHEFSVSDSSDLACDLATNLNLQWDIGTTQEVNAKNCAGTKFADGVRNEITLALTFFNPETCDAATTTCHHTAYGSLHAKVR